jgi:hypothetical protein
MKRSVNEIQGMVLKAARGAGVPLGHGEDLAAVAAGLALAEGGLAELVAVLAGPHEVVPPVVGGEKLIFANARAILAGPLALDAVQAGTDQAELRGLDAPLILKALADGRGNCGVEFQGDKVVVMRIEPQPLRQIEGPIEVNPDIWAVLERYSRKTFVPASEASRLAGAGAGLTDND